MTVTVTISSPVTVTVFLDSPLQRTHRIITRGRSFLWWGVILPMFTTALQKGDGDASGEDDNDEQKGTDDSLAADQQPRGERPGPNGSQDVCPENQQTTA